MEEMCCLAYNEVKMTPTLGPRKKTATCLHGINYSMNIIGEFQKLELGDIRI